jgi:hypothetical protein
MGAASRDLRTLGCPRTARTEFRRPSGSVDLDELRSKADDVSSEVFSIFNGPTVSMNAGGGTQTKYKEVRAALTVAGMARRAPARLSRGLGASRS